MYKDYKLEIVLISLNLKYLWGPLADTESYYQFRY